MGRSLSGDRRRKAKTKAKRGQGDTRKVQSHIDEIGAFIAQDSVDAALTVYGALKEAFELLAENPDIGHAARPGCATSLSTESSTSNARVIACCPTWRLMSG